MPPPSSSSLLPRSVWVLLGVYFLASLAHFAHNAEYIAYYPNMPVWLTSGQVYLAWLAVTGVGALGLLAARARAPTLGLVLLGAYGALGLDGLAHYTLALCSEHTIVTNTTIWAEAVTGLVLLLCSAVLLTRQFGVAAAQANAA